MLINTKNCAVMTSHLQGKKACGRPTATGPPSLLVGACPLPALQKLPGLAQAACTGTSSSCSTHLGFSNAVRMLSGTSLPKAK